jgi:uncharacterized protein (DUF1684 family)
MRHIRGLFVLCLALVVGGLGLPAQDAPALPDAPSVEIHWQQELLAWRTQREVEISASDGWLTLVGLEWLKPGANTFGAAADNRLRVRAQAPDHMGVLTVSGETHSPAPQRKQAGTRPARSRQPQSAGVVQLQASAGGFPADLLLDGKPAREGPLAVDDAKPSTLTWHGVTMIVLHRGDRYALRIKDADSPTRTAFNGLHWYAPDPRFRVTAKWIPYTPPRVEKIPTIIGTTLNMPAPGIAEFTLDGKPFRLEPVIEAGEEDKLFFILRDETSRTTTYGAARFLHTGLPDHGLAQPGQLTLDFNELYNPPCAYTPYATCPLPPEQNRLPVALEAGEQRYSH